jgi:hypothetical protein
MKGISGSTISICELCHGIRILWQQKKIWLQLTVFQIVLCRRRNRPCFLSNLPQPTHINALHCMIIVVKMGDIKLLFLNLIFTYCILSVDKERMGEWAEFRN